MYGIPVWVWILVSLLVFCIVLIVTGSPCLHTLNNSKMLESQLVMRIRVLLHSLNSADSFRLTLHRPLRLQVVEEVQGRQEAGGVHHKGGSHSLNSHLLPRNPGYPSFSSLTTTA
jgi:hypothetical protein